MWFSWIRIDNELSPDKVGSQNYNWMVYTLACVAAMLQVIASIAFEISAHRIHVELCVHVIRSIREWYSWIVTSLVAIEAINKSSIYNDPCLIHIDDEQFPTSSACRIRMEWSTSLEVYLVVVCQRTDWHSKNAYVIIKLVWKVLHSVATYDYT